MCNAVWRLAKGRGGRYLYTNNVEAFVGKRIATYCTPHTLTIYLFIIFLSNFISQTIFIHQISYIIILTIFNHKITTPLSHIYF